MKIILKNLNTKTIVPYEPKSNAKIRYGELITFVRMLEGSFNFQLYYRPFEDDDPQSINNQSDLNDLIDNTSISPLEILIGSVGQFLERSSFESSYLSKNASSNNSRFQEESSKRGSQAKSQVGKFRRTGPPSESAQETETNDIQNFITSRVSDVLDERIDQLIESKLDEKVEQKI